MESHTEIDEQLSLNEIKKDLRQCERMIRRCDHKLTVYNRKLNAERGLHTKEHSLLERGLALFGLNNSKHRNH